MAKFMLSLRDANFELLVLVAQERGISVQELIRAVIIPDWVRQPKHVAKDHSNENVMQATRAFKATLGSSTYSSR